MNTTNERRVPCWHTAFVILDPAVSSYTASESDVKLKSLALSAGIT